MCLWPRWNDDITMENKGGVGLSVKYFRFQIG